MSRNAVRNRRIWIPPAMLLAAALGAALLQAAPARDRGQSPATLPPPATAVPTATTSPSPAPVANPKSPAPKPAALVDFPIRSELSIPHWLRPGEFAWDDEHVPAAAAGETVVVVNLRGRVLSVYRGGHEIGRSSIVWGADEKPTPTGTFHILEKDANHHSRTYYNAPMPHMLRLTADGVSLHGSEMADDIATHGCVGLPREFAGLLFRAAKVGDRVLILKG
jgi:lipoprotein-anchoring transpeptidase ErfK/SrfK